MSDYTRKITYGAMMIALFAILLAVSLYTPLIGNVTMLFIPLPILLYRLRYDRSSSLLVTFAGILLSMLVGGIFVLPLSFMLAIFGYVIGETVTLGRTKLYVFMASGLSLLITSMLLYVGAVYFFQFNIIEEVFTMLRETQTQMMETMGKIGNLPKNYEQIMAEQFTMYENMIPAMFILAIFSIAFVLVLINLAIAKRLGNKVPVFPPFRDMKLPAFFVATYVIVVLFSLFGNFEPGTSAYMIITNATVILRVLFLLQGLSLIIFYMTHMKVPGIAIGFVIVFALLLSPITTLLGIVDAAANIRAWIGRDKTK